MYVWTFSSLFSRQLQYYRSAIRRDDDLALSGPDEPNLGNYSCIIGRLKWYKLS